MHAFEYQHAETIEGAAEFLTQDNKAQLLAGGMTLLPALKSSLVAPTALIDLKGLIELKGACVDGDALVIGALTTHVEVAESEVINSAIPALTRLAANIGDAQVRNRGTLGGSLASNDPSADYPAAVLGLEAVIRTNRRDIPAAEFFTGKFETALQTDEIILAVRFPIPEQAAYVKFPNPASHFAIVGVMVVRDARGPRIAVTGASACVFRARELEDALRTDFNEHALDGLKFHREDLIDDLYATAEYRAHLVMAMARRAVAMASTRG